jgi:hypothetical protein
MNDDTRRNGKTGRPPLDPHGKPSTPVNVRLPPQQFDAADSRAKRDRTSIPGVCRRALSKYLSEEDD